MRDWDSLSVAVIMLLLAIFFLVLEFTELIIQRDEPVTTTATILFCRTEFVSKGRSGREKIIYFHINKPPTQINYRDPDEYEEALLQRCDLRDRMKLTYYRRYFPITGGEDYWLMGMESLTDGQIILTPSNGGRGAFWCLLLPMVIVLLCASYFFFDNWRSYKPDPREIERQESLKNKLEMDKKEAIKALRSNPQNARIWLLLGWMMTEDKRAEQARECYERALKINLRSHKAGELSAETWPTWLDLVATEREVPLILEDSYAAPQTNSIPLPKWLDEEQKRSSFFSLLRRLLLNPVELFASLFIISLFGIILSHLFLREELLSRFFEYSFAVLLTLIPAMIIFKVIIGSITGHHWSKSSGIVIGSFVRRTINKGKQTLDLYLVCAYEVDQHIYYSTVPSEKTSFGSIYQSWGKRGEHYLQKQEKEFSFLKPMTIFYNLDQPDVIDQVGFYKETVGSLITMILFALVSGFASGMFWYLLLNRGN